MEWLFLIREGFYVLFDIVCFSHRSPSTLGSDGKHLTGLWIQGQKYFGGENVGEIGKGAGTGAYGIRGCQEMAGPVFFRTKAVSG